MPNSLRFLFAAIATVVVLTIRPGLSSSDKNQSFFFIQLADTQIGMTKGNTDLSPEIKNFSKAVEHINRLNPDFVIISGDLVNTPRDHRQIRAFWSVAREIRKDVPLFLVPGNHDINPATQENVASYRKLFGSDKYSFTHKGVDFIVLNSTLLNDPEADPELRENQKRWLDAELEKSGKRKVSHIFVCTHHPWFTACPDEPDAYQNIPGAARAEYLTLLKRSGVTYLLAGHLHGNAVTADGLLNLVTTCAVSKSHSKDKEGFRVFRVYQNRVEHDYYELDNAPEKIRM